MKVTRARIPKKLSKFANPAVDAYGFMLLPPDRRNEAM